MRTNYRLDLLAADRKIHHPEKAKITINEFWGFKIKYFTCPKKSLSECFIAVLS